MPIPCDRLLRQRGCEIHPIVNKQKNFMRLTLDRTQRIWLQLAPVAAIAVFAPNPASAATLATSEAKVNLYNFSHQPFEVSALIDHRTKVTGPDGQVTTGATANAQFLNDSPFPSATSLSASGASGDGTGYTGFAQSSAKVTGYNFAIGAGETFAFNFDAYLALSTQIDQPGAESATATGAILFQLFDSTDLDHPLNVFSFFGNLNTPGKGDFLRKVNDRHVTFSDITFDQSFGGNDESATASVQGSFSRSFRQARNLTLIEAQANQVTVKAPEPVNTPSLLFGGVALLTKLITKRRQPMAPAE